MAVPPWDLMIDILSCLPVKDLLRFRSVAKPWKTLIDGPDFIKLHLSHSLDNTSSSNSNLSVILKPREGLQIFDLDSLDPTVQPLGLPISAANFVVVGSRNGLVVLACSTSDLVLWNPSTRRHRIFPFSEFGGLPPKESYVVFPNDSNGFGYDPKSDDHKIVVATHYNSISRVRRFSVYSVNGGTWKSVDLYPIYNCESLNCGVSVGGYLNWLVLTKGYMDPENLTVRHIVGFDLSADEFRRIEIPKSDSSIRVIDAHLSELRGCLCMIKHSWRRSIKLWVMKEYGVQESWTKLFSVRQLLGSLRFPAYNITNAMYLNGTGRFLFEVSGQNFALCDVEKMTLGDFRVSGLPQHFRSHLYVQSFLGVDCVQPKAEDDGNKRTRQNRKDFQSKGGEKNKAVGSLRGRTFYPRAAKKIKLMEA